MAKPRTAPRSQPQELLEVDITRFTPDGLGLGPLRGKEVLVAGALPGERVAITIEHEGPRRIIGRLRRVLQRHAQRISPPCPHQRACQGCPLIALRYPAQLQLKEDKVRSALASHATLNQVGIAPVWGAAQPLGYRTNAKLVIAKERGKVNIGLYRRGSHQVVDIGDCPLHHPLINRIVAVVREEVERQKVWVYDADKRRGLLRYLAVKIAPATGKAMVTFVVAERNYREITHLAKWLRKKVPEVVSVQQNINASDGNVIFGRETLKVLGAPDLIDQVGDIRLRISPTSFFQVNNEQAARIYRLVRDWIALGREETAVDLYCGIGGIAFNLAQDGGKVIGIEAVEEAVHNARQNAVMNQLGHCSFRAGDAADLIHDLTLELPPGSPVVVNPPRTGCAHNVLKALAELAPRTLVYVSCNPETLARDLDILAGLGLQTVEIQPVDMFPQTLHVETVARLVPREGKKGLNRQSL